MIMSIISKIIILISLSSSVTWGRSIYEFDDGVRGRDPDPSPSPSPDPDFPGTLDPIDFWSTTTTRRPYPTTTRTTSVTPPLDPVTATDTPDTSTEVPITDDYDYNTIADDTSTNDPIIIITSRRPKVVTKDSNQKLVVAAYATLGSFLGLLLLFMCALMFMKIFKNPQKKKKVKKGANSIDSLQLSEDDIKWSFAPHSPETGATMTDAKSTPSSPSSPPSTKPSSVDSKKSPKITKKIPKYQK